MRILIIKMTSMGDVIHTLPAITDAKKQIPDLSIDWVVEDRFAAIPAWHPAVNTIIPVALRQWRKKPLQALLNAELLKLAQRLRMPRYDLIIDAQGLIKSTVIAKIARGKIAGFNRSSAREGLIASLFYHKKYQISWELHAVARLRQLFAQALNYALPQSIADYGLDTTRFMNYPEKDYILFLPATTWATKKWPLAYWRELVTLLKEQHIKIAWGNAAEKNDALQIAAGFNHANILPDFNISQMAPVINNAKCVIAVDTGFAHLAAALNKKTISLYGATDAKLTGTQGQNQIHLTADFPCAPCLSKTCTYQQPSHVTPACYTEITPLRVMRELQKYC